MIILDGAYEITIAPDVTIFLMMEFIILING